MIDVEAGKHCLSFETPISWNQRGPQGERGLQGERGAQGEQGLPGERAAEGARGPQGEHGTQGLQGLPGESGAQGEQGPQGIQSPQGERGAQGPAGPGGVSGSSFVRVVVTNVDDKGGLDGTAFGTALCPNAKVATGGGYDLESGTASNSIVVKSSSPWVSSSGAIGWSVTAVNTGAARPFTFAVIAICASAA